MTGKILDLFQLDFMRHGTGKTDFFPLHYMAMASPAMASHPIFSISHGCWKPSTFFLLFLVPWFLTFLNLETLHIF